MRSIGVPSFMNREEIMSHHPSQPKYLNPSIPSFANSTTRPRSASHETVSTACDSTGIPVRDFHISLDYIHTTSTPINSPFRPTSTATPTALVNNYPCNTFKISDFEDLSPFAEGSNALLFKAKVNGKLVIIKMIKKKVENEATVVREFELERSILENAHHENIVKYLGSGYEPRRFVVMEYLNQGTIGMLSNTTVSFKEALSRGRQLASALHYLHELCTPGVAILHRDIKPDNIGLCDGSIKLFDFGLSICVKQRENSSEAYEMTGMTGTLRYMAPEVALNKPYTEKVDVYSFGILLWQMLSQKVPFRNANRKEFFEYVVIGGCRPVVPDTWPPELGALVVSCWHPDPEARPSFAQLITLLDQVIYSSSILL